uniref:Uncharacterized protein n=1 Tax=Panagrolaimus sp. ES5 TaxID=591445 RepID=A0AC34FR74_9BILA
MYLILVILISLFFEVQPQAIGTGAQPTRTCNTCQQNNPPPPPPPPANNNPQWNLWGGWSQCSATCGGGFRSRQRSCNTQCGVCQCQGSSTEQQSCNVKPCCAYTNWSAWSQCTATCGTGIQLRTRQCSCLQCPNGSPSEQRTCTGAYQCPPTTCNTCNNNPPPPPPPPPPSCTTCNSAPPVACSTCGTREFGSEITMGSNAYYDPYRNAKKRRRRQIKL